MERGRSNTQQVLLRLPEATVHALLLRSADKTRSQLRRVTVQAVIREAIDRYLEIEAFDSTPPDIRT